MNAPCIKATLLGNGRWWARGKRHLRWQSCRTWSTEAEALAVAREFVRTGKLPPKKKPGFARTRHWITPHVWTTATKGGKPRFRAQGVNDHDYLGQFATLEQAIRAVECWQKKAA